MKEQNKIYEFDPVIYPFRLWVVNSPTKDFIKGNFFCLNPSTGDYYDFEDSDIPTSKTAYAVTSPVKNKKTKKNGALVMLMDIKISNISITAHEASHVCDILSDYVGIRAYKEFYPDGEPRAYIMEWAADCIYKVKTGKIK